jgi:hypothetical protein
MVGALCGGIYSIEWSGPTMNVIGESILESN